MPNIHFMSYADESGDAFVTAFVPGQATPLTASTSSHSNFAEIIQRLKDDDASVIDLFDVSKPVKAKFEKVSDRVAVEGGTVLFDGDPVDNAITKQIVRFFNEGVDDWIPLVNFMENVAANPNEHSRSQLFEWLDRHDFTITPEGYFVGYKGVGADYRSHHSGPGIVNGTPVNGRLDNSPGNTVEIARSYVHHDPSNGCSTGLHVGTYNFARTYGPVMLEVEVNPRDVVSVPTDCNAQKVRVCRYEVIDTVDAPYEGAFRALPDDEPDPDEYDDEDYWADETDDEYGDEGAFDPEDTVTFVFIS